MTALDRVHAGVASSTPDRKRTPRAMCLEETVLDTSAEIDPSHGSQATVL